MIYAVITGDIVKSSRLKDSQKDVLNESLREAFKTIKQFSEQAGDLPNFNIFRGDSFQGLFNRPEEALRAAVFIRSMLRQNQPDDEQNNWDARIAVGIGEVNYLPDNISEGDGAAYQNSGPVLDDLKGNFRSAVKTSEDTLNQELKTECALLDAIVAGWTKNRAEIIVMLLQGMTAKAISEKLDISQAAVHYRIKGAGWFAVEALLDRYKQIIDTINA